MKRTLIRLGLSALITSALFGCGGGGSDGVPGTSTPPVTVTTTGPGLNPATITAAQWASLEPKGTITGVTIPTTADNPPVVTFTLTDGSGNAIVGLESITSKTANAKYLSYPNLGFTLAKLVPGQNNSPSRWVSYTVLGNATETAPFTLGRPSTENNGTLEAIDPIKAPGQYRYTFRRDPKTVKDIVAGTTDSGNNKKADLDDLKYYSSLTHRVGIQFAGAARGTSTNTLSGSESGVPLVLLDRPVNIFYDFIPATGKQVTDADEQREIVNTAACFECHTKFVGFHSGVRTENVLPASRQDTKMCVLCHTDQRKFGQPEATPNGTGTGYTSLDVRRVNGNSTLNMMPFIHTLHMGSRLTKTGMTIDGIKANEIVYPQSVANCAKCHTGSATATNKTLNGDNWKTKPSRLACGSCHDKINFDSGANHNAPGTDNVQKDDSKCASCHNATLIAEKHAGENATLHNPIVKTGLKNFKYEIKSATATATAVNVVFKITTDNGIPGAAYTPITLLPATAGGVANPLTGFTGSPSFLLAYAKTQDGVTTPVDYNNLGNGVSNAQPKSVSIAALLNTNTAGTTGTLSAPDGNGYYTATIVGSSNVFPTGAVMRTVALQSYFTQITAPATATVGIGRHTLAVVQTVTGDTERRSVVDSAKCGNCHEWFEGHGGQRNIGADSTGKVPAGANIVVCVVCHNPGIVTSGRGISDAALAVYPFTASDNAILDGWLFDKTLLPNAALKLPQTTNNLKDMIHGIHAGKDRADPIRIARDRTPGAINLIDGANIKFPGNLQKCESCHKPGTYSSVPANTLVTTHEADNGVRTNGVRTVAHAKASLATPNTGDLVTTPFTAACVSCHDQTTPIAHMKSFGGQILVARNAANSALETCSVCHAAGRDADPAVVHKK